MNPSVEIKAASTGVEDPFRYGWRYVRRDGTDGSGRYERVPLSVEDLLHPQEDDFIVETEAHEKDCGAIHNALLTQTSGRAGWRVLRNHRVDWEVEGVQPLGPDLVVFEERTPSDLLAGTYRVAEQGARAVLVVEVTSPSTRDIDLDDKVLAYDRCGVPLYVIVDGRAVGTGREIRLLAYRVSPDGYTRVRPDNRGRLWIEPVRIWLASESGRVVCYDEKDKQFEDYPVVREKLSVAEARAEALEERNRELEAELRRPRGES